jgi:hypothetical protein
MAVPFETHPVTIAGQELVAEAMMNSCSNLWTATVRASGRVVATGAGNTPEDAIAAAVERAEAALAATPAS